MLLSNRRQRRLHSYIRSELCNRYPNKTIIHSTIQFWPKGTGIFFVQNECIQYIAPKNYELVIWYGKNFHS